MDWLGEYGEPVIWDIFTPEEKLYMIHHWPDVIYQEMTTADIRAVVKDQ